MKFDQKRVVSYLKEKFIVLHIKPYNKDIYNHVRCSAALL